MSMTKIKSDALQFKSKQIGSIDNKQGHYVAHPLLFFKVKLLVDT